jgi:four helix bundle protein
MAYHSFEDLEVWKRSCRLTVKVYELFKNSKEYVLRDQMTRSALSIPSNIAEGAERSSSQEFIRFLNIAKGSVAELRTQLYIASEIGVIDDSERNVLKKELMEISSMLQSLIRSLKSTTIGRSKTSNLKPKT